MVHQLTFAGLDKTDCVWYAEKQSCRWLGVAQLHHFKGSNLPFAQRQNKISIAPLPRWLSFFTNERTQACSEAWPGYPLCLQRARASFVLQLRAPFIQAAVLLSSAPHSWGWEYISLHRRKQKIGLQRSSQGWINGGHHPNGLMVVTMAAGAVDSEMQDWIWLVPESVGSYSELQLLHQL